MKIPKPWYRASEGKWYVQIGKSQKCLGKDKTAAYQAYEQIMRDRGIAVTTSKITFHKLIDAYANWLSANRAESTCKSRESIWKSLKQYFSPSLRAESLQPYQVLAWLDDCKVTNPTTRNTRITMLIGVFNWAKRLGHVKSNPIADTPKPQPLVHQDFIPPKRFQEFLDNCPNERFHDFVFVMLDTGARAEEMFKLTAEHWRENGRFILPITSSKGRRRSRTIYVPETSRPIIEKLIERYPVGPLFRNSRGRKYDKDSIKCTMRRIKEKMGLPRLNATLLRHSFAHNRLVSGQDALTVSKLLGHADGRMLATRYGHLEGSDYLATKANEHALKPQASPAEERPANPSGESAPRRRRGRKAARTAGTKS